jgi:hypothetical protein
LGYNDFQTIVVLVIFGFEGIHVSSYWLISARARGKFAFVMFANLAPVLSAYVTCFCKKHLFLCYHGEDF